MFAALVALTLAAPVGADDKDKEKPLSEAGQKELKKFDGKWKGEKLMINESEESPPDGDEGILQFKGRKVLMGGKELFDVAALDPSTDPKILDLKAVADMGPVIRKDTVYEAIYKFDGDTLVIAVYVGEGSKRPAKFESPKDSNVAVVTLKKQKD